MQGDKTTASIVGHVILSLAAMIGTYAACWTGAVGWSWWFVLCGAMLGFIPVAVAMNHYSRAVNAMATIAQSPAMQPGVQVQVQPALPPVVQVQMQPDAAVPTPTGVHAVQPSTVPTPGVGGLVALLATLGALGAQHARHLLGPLSMVLVVLSLTGCSSSGGPGSALFKTLDAVRLICSAEAALRPVVTLAMPSTPAPTGDAGTDPDAPIR